MPKVSLPLREKDDVLIGKVMSRGSGVPEMSYLLTWVLVTQVLTV